MRMFYCGQLICKSCKKVTAVKGYFDTIQYDKFSTEIKKIYGRCDCGTSRPRTWIGAVSQLQYLINWTVGWEKDPIQLASESVVDERIKQLFKHGFANDIEKYPNGELIQQTIHILSNLKNRFQCEDPWYLMKRHSEEELIIIASALCMAEIDRMRRVKAKQFPSEAEKVLDDKGKN